MFKLLEYFGRVQALRGQMTRLPAWARVLIFIAALPGAILIGLSIVAFVVSLLALLLLTVPLYRVLRAITVGSEAESQTASTGMSPDAPDVFGGAASSGRRKIEVTIVEPAAAEPR